jgi:hypothetical protein
MSQDRAILPGTGLATIEDSSLIEDERAFLARLQQLRPGGSTIGNRELRKQLAWDDERYFDARNALDDKGRILRGVRIVTAEATFPRRGADDLCGVDDGRGDRTISSGRFCPSIARPTVRRPVYRGAPT